MSDQTPQKMIQSGYGANSTADEVLNGIDLNGQTAIVTGGYSGLGLKTTKSLLKAGATVIVAGRRPEVAKKALHDSSRIEIAALDLSRLQSVNRFAEEFLESGRQLDLLINNAAVMACPEQRTGKGWEMQFAVNHLGHYVLTNKLWPALRKAGQRGRTRVISVSSAGHHHSAIRWDDIHFTNDAYHKWTAYGQSKTANSLFAVELDKRGKEDGIRTFSVHPGSILTPLQRHMTRDEMMELGWVDKNGELIDPSFKTPEQGAATQVWAATSPLLDGMGGVYCEDCNIAEPAGENTPPFTGVKTYAVDPDEAARLWHYSAKETELHSFD